MSTPESKVSNYHYDLGKALAELINEHVNDNKVEYRGYSNITHENSDEIVLDCNLGFVDLGYWISEAQSIVHQQYLGEKDGDT